MKHLRNIVLLITVAFIISSCATAEVRAVRKGDLLELDKFLSSGENPNAFYADGNALIHIAVQYGQTGSLEHLLLADAKPNLLNSAGNTAAILAAGKNRIDMINILMNYGGDMKIPGGGGRTTLMLAAANGSVQMMERLLYAGVPVKAVDRSGLSALFYSVSGNNPDALSLLINSGAEAGLTDNNGRTPLHLLTQNEQRPFARLLLQAGADPSRQQSTSGETPLHIASGSGAWELVEEYLTYGYGVQQQINQVSTRLGAPLFYALNPKLPSTAAVKTLRILLDAGADPNLPSAQEILPIIYAVEKLDTPRIELLINAGAQLSISLSEMRTLLHIAASRDMPELVSVLLNAGVDPDSKDLQGNTALFISVAKPAIDTAEVLLAFGADPDVINNAGKTVLYITLERDADRRSGISGETSQLLRYEASLPPGRDIPSQLLLRTAESGNARVAEILLKAGANPDESDQNGMTILMLASSRNFIELSEVLLLEGSRMNMRDVKGNTAMHFSSKAGSVEGVELLLRYGENPDTLNYESIRPIQLAPENDRGLRIIEILQSAGAQPLPLEAQPEIDNPTEEDNIDDIIVEIKPETTVIEEEIVTDNTDIDQDDETDRNEEWGKARVLYLGESEPRRISEKRITFPEFSAQVPESYPQNMFSKSNQREVLIYVRNETQFTTEIYLVSTDGIIEAVMALPPGEFIEIETQQGNIYPVYTQGSEYFGEIQTTGQEEQFYRLVENN